MNHFENKTFSYVFEHLRGISVPTYVVLFFSLVSFLMATLYMSAVVACR